MTVQDDRHIMSGIYSPIFLYEFAYYIEENYNINEEDI